MPIGMRAAVRRMWCRIMRRCIILSGTQSFAGGRAAERVDNCARGAALMSGTTVEIITTDGLCDFIPNRTLSAFIAAGDGSGGRPSFYRSGQGVGSSVPEGISRIGAQSQNESYEKTMAPQIAAQLAGKSLMDIILPLRFDSAASLDLQM